MEEEVPPERHIELGDRHAARGELDLAIRCYNLVLKKDLSNPAANRRLANSYRLKAEAGETVFYKLAVTPLRRALKTSPLDEELHELLLLLALKTGDLDALTREYGKKAKDGPEKEFHGKYLKRVCAMSVMGSGLSRPGLDYKPIPFVKSFFDLIVLPGAILSIAAGNAGVKFKPFLLLGTTLFLFYCVYRVILYLLMRRQ